MEFTFFRFIGWTFLLLIGVVLGFAIFSDFRTVAAMGSVLFFIWAAVVFPLDDLQDWGEYLKSSEFGRDVQSYLQKLLPWRSKDNRPGGRRRGRGQVDARTLALASVVVVSTLTGGYVATASASAASGDQTCSTAVVHDAFRTDNETVSKFNSTGRASSIKQNTRVTLTKDDAFYRLKAENPNGYCVHVTVEIAGEVVPPAELGTINALNSSVTGEWHDVHDFENQSSHTTVEFSVPAGTTVTFAPSKPKVLLPAWRDKSKRELGGIVQRVAGFSPFEDEDLTQRTYTITADNGSSYVTVPLTNPDTGQSIEEWNAVYRTAPNEPWRPVDTDSEDAVFFRRLDGDQKIQLVFNDRNATVEFTANPTTVDEVQNSVRSYLRSLHDLRDLDIFTTIRIPTQVIR
jgi:hypothetical protein